MGKQKPESQETKPEKPTLEEKEPENPEEPDPVDIPDKRDSKSKQDLDCEFLGGNYSPQGKLCTMENIDDGANKYIFGIKEKHSRKAHEEDKSEFKLKYLDEKGYRNEIKTDMATTKIWIMKNRQKLKPEFFKNNKSYIFKEKIIE